MTNAVPRKWTLADSIETYEIRTWGSPYFGVNEKGNVSIHPDGPGGPSADLKELVDEVRRRGIGLPLLLRFSDILRKRVTELNESFARAIAEYGYSSEYRGVYPIKVNQVSNVVAEILNAGRPYHYGLEAGSKPELLAVMALIDDPEALIVCNGYKDEEYVETALLASKLDRKVILVVEKLSELPLIAAVSKKLGVRPRIGIRVKLSSRGSGRWEASGGDRSKFGLSASEVLEAMAFMRQQELLDCFKLLHFHLGSQISAIRSFKNALREAGRFYVELAKAGAPLEYFDVGGGLGVDYDGSQTNFASSMNYTMQEYANDIVYGLKEICDTASVPHPYIVSESGRAVVAHHAVLVVDVLGTLEFENKPVPDSIPADAAPVVKNLFATYKEVTRKNLQEAYHDAVDLKEECLQLFSLGHLSLDERVMAERIYWSLCHRVAKLASELDERPEELEHLEKTLSDTYFCNFSVFQSLPDSWAIDHLFPVMPIHRLGEEPTRRAVLADITCDSDGKIEHFIDRRDVKDVLELHPVNGSDYYLGIFLVGAYQEILGDLHNLFGDTNDVQVSLGDGGYVIDHVAPGDTVAEVLKYVSYSKEELVARLRRSVEQALRGGKITLDESRYVLRAYEEGLAGYTYLERD
ncbi:biosynthetic arginine decarboxylase [Vulgatibacter incomptus]|uniref:Biosynthetic arginine decarboxylase n=1 Tax=Vulgatibacter incomptus TaxID=1391653 RepID=A0A0K1PE61_9BACT|nr:biosynthetic arginine decarboxylase [Vulgatibacter incomptus]AKU91414.1 Biosynthetic arginine decarboxylase [Vulgatibacter incomptus]